MLLGTRGGGLGSTRRGGVAESSINLPKPDSPCNHFQIPQITPADSPCHLFGRFLRFPRLHRRFPVPPFLSDSPDSPDYTGSPSDSPCLVLPDSPDSRQIPHATLVRFPRFPRFPKPSPCLVFARFPRLHFTPRAA